MNYLRFVFVVFLLAFLVGCGGSSGSGGSGCCTVPGINVQIVSPTGAASVDGNPTQSLAIKVKVTNDSSNAGVTWTLAPVVRGAPAGTLSAEQSFSVNYSPPTGVTQPTQVTVTATSVTDATRSVNLPITIYPPLAPTKTLGMEFVPAFLNTNYTCVKLPISNGVAQSPCYLSVQGGLAPYTWSLGNTELPNGLQLAPGPDQFSTEIIGIPIATGIYPFTLTATDANNVSVSYSQTISVAPSQLKVPTPTVMNVLPGQFFKPIQLQATGGTPPYTWNLAPGSVPLPSWANLSPSGVLSANPPAAIPAGGYSFAVQVSDSQNPVPAQAIYPVPASSGGNIITLTTGQNTPTDYQCQPGTSYSLQAGVPYAFTFSGFDANGPVGFSGSFTADTNGNLTGVEDIIRSSGVQLAQPLTAGSTMLFDVSSVSSDITTYRGCLTLNTGSSSNLFTVAPTAASASGALNLFTAGRIMEFDDTTGTGTRGTGSFRMQDSSAFATAPAGAFVFRLSGWDASIHHFAMAGTATTADGTVTSVTADVNDAGALSGPLAGSGSIIAADANGRGTFTISAGTANYNLIYYIVDANDLLLGSPQVASIGHPLITGEATASAGPFSQSTLSNSHIYRLGGDVAGSPDVAIGILHFDGLGAVSGTNYERSGGSAAATTVSAQYSVDPNSGRFTFTGTSAPAIGYAIPSANGLTGYLVGTGASAASGAMEFQTNSYPPGYQFSPFAGSAYGFGFATEEMLEPQATVVEGQEFPAPSGSFSGGLSYVDSSDTSGLYAIQQFDLFNYTWGTDGSGTWGGNTFMVTNGTKLFYIDTSPLNGYPGVVVGSLQHP